MFQCEWNIPKCYPKMIQLSLKNFGHHSTFSQLYVTGELRTNMCSLVLSDLYQQFFTCSATERIFMIMLFRNSKGYQNDSGLCGCSLILMHFLFKGKFRYTWKVLLMFFFLFVCCPQAIFVLVSSLVLLIPAILLCSHQLFYHTGT